MYRTLGQLTKVSTKTVPRTSPTYAAPHFSLILLLMRHKVFKFLGLALLAAYPVLATTAIHLTIDPAVGLTNSLWIYDAGNTQLYFAGGLDLTIAGYSRLVYCVELDRNVNVPGDYNTTMDFADTAGLQRVGWLMQNDWPSAPALGYTGVSLQEHGAAFQLAIWDILTDNGNGFGTPLTPSGKVSQSTDPANPTNSNVLTYAVAYEALSLNHTSAYGIIYHNTDSNGNTVQTLMGPTPDDGPSAPEPAAVILIFSGLALIGLSRLRSSARTH